MNIYNKFIPDMSIRKYYNKRTLNKILIKNEFFINEYFYFGDDSFLKMKFAKLRICSISKKNNNYDTI